MNSIDYSIT